MPGMIMLWAGAVVDIPSGWHLCDGTMGTPNLDAKFVLGAGAAYAVDSTGGSEHHTHTTTGSPHSHPIAPGAAIASGSGYDEFTESVGTSGVTDQKSHLNPFHALCYIMKIN